MLGTPTISIHGQYQERGRSQRGGHTACAGVWCGEMSEQGVWCGEMSEQRTRLFFFSFFFPKTMSMPYFDRDADLPEARGVLDGEYQACMGSEVEGHDTGTS